MTKGIHHITAISSSAQKTYDFYTGILGLRLVKKTVNFDDPTTYHLYFGNEKGEPGTILTFFPFRNTYTGMRGTGQVTKIQFQVPKDAIGFWLERFIKKGVKHKQIETVLGNTVLTFFDFDGLQLELIASNENSAEPWESKEVPKDKAISGFFGAELSVDKIEKTKEVLEKYLGYSQISSEEFTHRFENKGAKYAKYIDILEMKGWPEGIVAAGTVHHIAFRMNNQNEEIDLMASLNEADFNTTDVIDRKYFKSVYFREPNNILFELATDDPGFTVDEKLDDLGKSLKIPEQYESYRDSILNELPELITDSDGKQETNEDLFKYKFIKSENAKKTIILFHGTGADENDLIPLAKEVTNNFNILSIRGNVSENGFNRFFERYRDGSFNIDSIKLEISKFEIFINNFSSENNIKFEDITLLGFSNGANFILSYILLHPGKIKNIIALHPMLPFTPEEKINLEGTNILITYGERDEYSTKEEIRKLRDLLTSTKAKLDEYQHNANHVITEEEVEKIKEWIERI